MPYLAPYPEPGGFLEVGSNALFLLPPFKRDLSAHPHLRCVMLPCRAVPTDTPCLLQQLLPKQTPAASKDFFFLSTVLFFHLPLISASSIRIGIGSNSSLCK